MGKLLDGLLKEAAKNSVYDSDATVELGDNTFAHFSTSVKNLVTIKKDFGGTTHSITLSKKDLEKILNGFPE